jgi:DNA-binding NarL/FixJ family response regulator
LANSQPAVCIIVISALSDAGSIYTAIESGAVGYIHKDDNSMTLQSSIRMALRGESPISPMIARRIFSNIKNSSKDLLGEGESKKSIASDILTDRELQVLHVISKGLSYSEAASALEISHKTVPTHIRNIYRKLQVNNRSEAVYEARQMGILK